MTIGTPPPATPQRRANEALPIEHFYQSADDGTTYGAPSADSDGIQCPDAPNWDLVSLDLIKAAASGTRTLRVKVHGYRRWSYTQTSNVNAARASSGYWVKVFDTGALSDSADFTESYLFEDLQCFERLAVEIVTNGGATPVLTAIFSFSKQRRK